jgi:hypothetical protein
MKNNTELANELVTKAEMDRAVETHIFHAVRFQFSGGFWRNCNNNHEVTPAHCVAERVRDYLNLADTLKGDL